jgi:hypothetical protein
MLRITARVEPTETVLELEGKLTGLWTEEFQRFWEKWLIENRPVRVVLRPSAYPPARRDASGQDASNRDSLGRGGMHDERDY